MLCPNSILCTTRCSSAIIIQWPSDRVWILSSTGCLKVCWVVLDIWNFAVLSDTRSWIWIVDEAYAAWWFHKLGPRARMRIMAFSKCFKECLRLAIVTTIVTLGTLRLSLILSTLLSLPVVFTKTFWISLRLHISSRVHWCTQAIYSLDSAMSTVLLTRAEHVWLCSFVRLMRLDRRITMPTCWTLLAPMHECTGLHIGLGCTLMNHLRVLMVIGDHLSVHPFGSINIFPSARFMSILGACN